MGSLRNWADARDYEFCDGLSKQGWAWEFLRRNREYRADWEQELKKAAEGKPGLLKRINGPRFCLMSDLAEKWGLFDLWNPEQDKPYGFRVFHEANNFISLMDIIVPHEGNLSMIARFGNNASHIVGGRHLTETQIPVIVDLSYPLKPQLSRIAKELRKYQKWARENNPKAIKSTKLHMENWETYLRILDATTLGAPDREIAAGIFPFIDNDYPEYAASKRVSDTRKQAQALVDSGYREIVAGD